MYNQKLYTQTQIPVDYHRQIKYQQFTEWICLGRSRTSSIMMSTILYFFTYKKIEALKQLARPRKGYTNNNSRLVATFLNEAIQYEKKDKFIEKMQQYDPTNEKSSYLLQEFCYIMKSERYNKDQVFTQFAELLDLQIKIVNYPQQIGNGNNKIFLFFDNQCYYYLVEKIREREIIPKQNNICWMCQQEAKQYLKPNCQHLICLSCLVNQFKNKDEVSCKYNSYCNQKIKKQSLEYQKLLNSQLSQMPTSNQLSQQSKQNGNQKQSQNCSFCHKEQNCQLLNCQHQLCLTCLQMADLRKGQCPIGGCLLNKSVQSQLINKEQSYTIDKSRTNQKQFQTCSFCHKEQNCQLLNCQHQLCQYCLQTAQSQKVQCPIDGCLLNKSVQSQLTDKYQSYPIDKYRSQERIDPLTTSSIYKQCGQCSQTELRSQLFFNVCNHSICKKCFPKIISSMSDCRCRQRDCQQRIDKKSLYLFLNQQKVQFACCKCQENYSVDDLYFHSQCYHAICFTCAQSMIEKYKVPQFICPAPNCSFTFKGTQFEQFYESYQIRILQLQAEYDQKDQQLEKQEQFQQQQQQQSEPRGSRFQLSNQSQLKQQDQSKSQIISDECTMCNSPFTEYNLKQEIDCSIHKIGVCCIKQFQKCQQCETKKVNQSAIRPKQKLILQTLQMPNQNDMLDQQNDFTENARSNSRIQQTQSQIRNNTTDNSLLKSQNLKFKSTYGK